MILRVERGKGGKDRHAMLSPLLLELLQTGRASRGRRSGCFPGSPVDPLTTRQLSRACHATAQMAEITKRVSPRTLRHSSRRISPSRSGYPGDPGSSRTREARYDRALSRVATKTIHEVIEPARSSDAA